MTGEKSISWIFLSIAVASQVDLTNMGKNNEYFFSRVS
jgi:hypothetical protein